MTIAEVLASVKLRPMEDKDYEAYGNSSNNAYIGESSQHTVIVDGLSIYIFDDAGNEVIYKIEEVK